jgi:ATP-dependent exoDNAse (exonuclease V) beta subunit
LDEQLGLSAVIQNKGFPEAVSPEESYCLLDLLRSSQNRKELSELKRLFYVGCTRAKDQLILSATIKKGDIPPSTPLNWLIEALEINPDELTDGLWEYHFDKKIRIWRSYETYDQEASQIQSIQKSIKKLKKAMEVKVVKKKKPLFLFPINDQPKGEIFSATQLLTFSRNREEYFRPVSTWKIVCMN